MKTKAYTYPSASALATIHAWQWYPEDGNVKAVLLLHHGMAEHCGRYGDFLQAFADMGYAVFMHDMLGHGQSCETPEDRGSLAIRTGTMLCCKMCGGCMTLPGANIRTRSW